MRDSQDFGQPGGLGDRTGEDLTHLARTVVARLTERAPRRGLRTDPAFVQAIRRAVLTFDPAAFHALRPDLRRARISDAALIDQYFPAVARELGCNWVDDSASFAEVTVGMARLQSLVHQIGRTLMEPSPSEGLSVLVVLPKGEAHGFGAQVMASQLRRQGISVHLLIGPDPGALQQLVRDRPYDGAFVSIGCEDMLAPGRRLVERLKKGSYGRLWVAVGGAVLERTDAVLAVTGADLATSDVTVAVSELRRISAANLGMDIGAAAAGLSVGRLERA
jgi:MerR family transcriptional regulator, light-induced transcriptional regulator